MIEASYLTIPLTGSLKKGDKNRPIPGCNNECRELRLQSRYTYRPQNPKCPKIKSAPKSKVPQNQKCPKIKSGPKSKVPQNQKYPKIKSAPKSKVA